MTEQTGSRKDPLPAFRFYISLVDSSSMLAKTSGRSKSIDKSPSGGFSECTGLDGTLEVHEYKEGGVNEFVHKFPTRAEFSPIVLKRGMGLNDDLWKWLYAYVEGRGKRKDGMIFVMDEKGESVRKWKFKRGLPLKWTGPDLNATQNALAIESLEISHEGLELL